MASKSPKRTKTLSSRRLKPGTVPQTWVRALTQISRMTLTTAETKSQAGTLGLGIPNLMQESLIKRKILILGERTPAD